MNSVDYKRGERITLFCIIGNVLLSIFKFITGIIGNSKAMVADALHSVSDVIATIAVFIGIKIAKKPIDQNHHYGHGKVEPLVAFFVGIILFFAAISVTERIIQSIRTHSFLAPSFIALIAAFVSIIVKEIMFRITYIEGKKINSESIMANAWDHRSDAYSSIATVFGIGFSMLGHHFNIPWLQYMDPLAGMIVACMIFRVAYCIIKQSIKGLMDASPDTHIIKEIECIILECEEVLGIPWIKARYIGQHLFIDLALEVDANITVKEGHTISTEIEKKIKNEIEDAYEVIIHVEPFEQM